MLAMYPVELTKNLNYNFHGPMQFYESPDRYNRAHFKGLTPHGHLLDTLREGPQQ